MVKCVDGGAWSSVFLPVSMSRSLSPAEETKMLLSTSIPTQWSVPCAVAVTIKHETKSYEELIDGLAKNVFSHGS